jgi:hypothetical protein
VRHVADPVDVDALHAEIERLRAIVGPDEAGHHRLLADRDRAVAAAKASEHELGRARGTIAEMQVQLVRARQDQERYQRALTIRRSVVERLARGKRRLFPRRSSRP